MTEKYIRFKITTKKGLVFEMILTDWLKEGNYEFGKVEVIDALIPEQEKDYISIIESLFEMCDGTDE